MTENGLNVAVALCTPEHARVYTSNLEHEPHLMHLHLRKYFRDGTFATVLMHCDRTSNKQSYNRERLLYRALNGRICINMRLVRCCACLLDQVPIPLGSSSSHRLPEENHQHANAPYCFTQHSNQYKRISQS